MIFQIISIFESLGVKTTTMKLNVKLLLLPAAAIAALWLGGCEGDSITIDDGGTTSPTDPELAWSASSYEATIGGTNTWPELANSYGVSVTYSSSNTSVATIGSSSGDITLVAEGTTTITASSEADGTYSAGSASYTLTVLAEGSNLVSAELSWPATSYTATLGETFTSPTLNNPHGLTVTYSSSNTSVATVSSSGTVTPVAAGTTTITASSEADETYRAGSAWYTLLVTSGEDDGAVPTTFPSAGDSSSDDDISNTAFSRLVTVTYSSGGASVSGYSAVADLMSVTVSGNQVTVTYTGEECVAYKLTGSASDGFFKLYSSKKQALWLSGLTLTSSSGAAINNQSGKRTFVYVDGSNTLSDSSSSSYSTTGDEDMKGVFFSEGQLIFSGSGSLTVNAVNSQSKSGIVSDDYVRLLDSPTITVTSGSSAGHGLKGKDYVQLSSGALNITAKAAMKKGITSEGYVLVEGGSHTINVSGGVAYDSDDKEYKGSAGIKADNYFGMTGGTVKITNTGAGGKGVRAGSYDYVEENSVSLSDSYISGGSLTVSTTGSESNDVSSKGIKIGYKEQTSSSGRGSYTYGGNMTVSGGAINVTCSKSEGFETKGTLTFSGGETYVYSSADDAINSQGEMDITGGYIYAYSSGNDALDSNSDLKISGGCTFAICTKGSPEVAIDANTEQNYKLYIYSGAVLVAYGGLESGYSASQTVYSMSCTAGSWNALYNGSSYIAAFKAPSGVSSVAVSAPSLSQGYTGVSVSSSGYLCNSTWAASGISGGTAVSLSSYNGGSGGGGGGGGRPGGGGGGGGRW